MLQLRELRLKCWTVMKICNLNGNILSLILAYVMVTMKEIEDLDIGDRLRESGLKWKTVIKVASSIGNTLSPIEEGGRRL